MNDTKYNFVSFKQGLKDTNLHVLRETTQNV